MCRYGETADKLEPAGACWAAFVPAAGKARLPAAGAGTGMWAASGTASRLATW
jgi:hypothetical protein